MAATERLHRSDAPAWASRPNARLPHQSTSVKIPGASSRPCDRLALRASGAFRKVGRTGPVLRKGVDLTENRLKTTPRCVVATPTCPSKPWRSWRFRRGICSGTLKLTPMSRAGASFIHPHQNSSNRIALDRDQAHPSLSQNCSHSKSVIQPRRFIE